MAFAPPEDVGTTPRAKLMARQRLQVWELHRGTCVICERRIDGVRERWIVEHVCALELGGADAIANMGPAHELCGREKTRDDHRRTARAKRKKQRHLGLSQPLRLIPGSRRSPLKRKLDGTIVQRDQNRLDSSLAADCAVERRAEAPPFPLCRTSFHAAEPCQIFGAPPEPNKRRPDEGDVSMPDKQPGRRSKQEAKAEVLPPAPHHLGALLEKRRLLSGESEDSYDALRQSVIKAVNPTDVIEAIWVQDLIDLIWESKRLRRWRVQIIEQARQKAAQIIIAQADEIHPDAVIAAMGMDSRSARASMAQKWLNGQDRESFTKVLRRQGLTEDDVIALAFQLRLSECERIDRLAAAADDRRDALLREIERKRASSPQAPRAAASRILDAEVLTPSPHGAKR